MTATYTLRACRSTLVAINKESVLTPRIAVYDFARQGALVEKFELMCAAIDCDIQTAEGSGACVLEWIRKVESGEIDIADVDGNAWVMNITRDKVWFEGLYSQGEGGEVTIAQYKLAVETYVRFLADPERKPIEVDFPA
ncbi:hypothetical protein [Variovorax sp.]|uniref:hypothetical protein n=1 Tax=Variovorax sp. TaxID=1871043 RepID=UPI002D645B12|nr:hypothetical protein [Variovorax sp.]HYP86393.1 hypothetical protein [Variovorax sp.]